MTAIRAWVAGARIASLGLLALTILSLGCRTEVTGPANNSEGPADWLAWRSKRHESIAGTNGWTTLIARHWLPEGLTTVGSHASNSVVLPKDRVPPVVGGFHRRGREVSFEAASGVEARVAGLRVRECVMKSDRGGDPTVVQVGEVSFVIIERGERLGLRVRDPQAPERTRFEGLRYLPYDPQWRVDGRFEPYSKPRSMRVADVAGGTQELMATGELVFSHSGVECRLVAIEESDAEEYFVMFRDSTNGRATNAAGRFLYVPKLGANGLLTLDFNRAFNPPCGFTPYATCPLPPMENTLPFHVRAGELKPLSHP
ncbi:MAG: DUF1684 domain-containing protein [Verrucomicrobiales bacterium]|nr:DUF1684 domain-containing protein [Verrucomicrobiales bacterium]